MQDITLSFIVPIFNTEKYLVECIVSILKQPISKEIILIDDGSSDNSLNIALIFSRQYKFITIVHSQNQGQSAARNKGIKLAKGKYIYFIDSDDHLLDYNLQSICDLATKNNIDIIKLQAQQTIEYRNNAVYNIKPASPQLEPNATTILSGEKCLSLMNKCWMPAVCWSIIRRELLSEQNLSFYENTKAEDQLFYIQLLTCHSNIKVMEVNSVIYNYRLRQNSTVTTITDQFFLDHFTICSLLDDWKNKHNFNAETQNNIESIMAKLYRTAFVMHSRFTQERKNKYQHYITDEILQLIKKHIPNFN